LGFLWYKIKFRCQGFTGYNELIKRGFNQTKKKILLAKRVCKLMSVAPTRCRCQLNVHYNFQMSRAELQNKINFGECGLSESTAYKFVENWKMFILLEI